MSQLKFIGSNEFVSKVDANICFGNYPVSISPIQPSHMS